MLKPIPLFLLKDSIVLRQYTGIDSREKPIYNDIQLDKVYLKFVDGDTTTTSGNRDADTLKVFFDNTNSSPKGRTFSTKDRLLLTNANEYGLVETTKEFAITQVIPSAFNHHISIGAK